MITADASKTRRLELILRQIDSLPTLPAIATRLLSLTASDQSHAREVVELISSDQALTAKVLSICRHADLGIRDEVMSIDRAVVLLGFNAIRNAVLSIKVFEVFGSPRQGAMGQAEEIADESDQQFDRPGFWRHSLAVAIVSEALAARHPGRRDLTPAEAFVCGLLHDIGKLALDHVLPKSFARVVELTDLNQGNIAEFERRIVGLDHHTAGKRLAEQWQLPHRLQDCIWLHGAAYDTLPRLEHRRMIGLIGLADLVVRRQHVGYSGNHTFKEDPAELARILALDPSAIDHAIKGLHEELERRSRALGLDNKPSRELFLESIQQANHELGRLNGALERRSRTTARQGQILEAISGFHAGATPGRGVQDVLNAVAASAAAALGAGFYTILYPTDSSVPGGASWLFCQYDKDCQVVRSQLIEPPPQAQDLTRLDARDPLSMSLMGLIPWIADYLADSPDLRQIRLLPLGCGWGTAAILLHDRPQLPPWQLLSPLVNTWGSAVAAAGQHEGARRLGEDLAEANRALAETQDRLLHSEAMARLGEMASGAAHEMNNPLAVISGRSELLAMSLPAESKERKAAQTIYEQAHRLSDLITSLRLFADPPKATRQPTDLGSLLQGVVRQIRADPANIPAGCEVYLQVRKETPQVNVDGEQIALAVTELMLNALQAAPRSMVQIGAQVAANREMMIQVTDDGMGIDSHVLAHAMDPFFSAKPAGRRVGMGLPRAQQLAAAHGGRIELRSSPDTGTVATLIVPLDSGP